MRLKRRAPRVPLTSRLSSSAAPVAILEASRWPSAPLAPRAPDGLIHLPLERVLWVHAAGVQIGAAQAEQLAERALRDELARAEGGREEKGVQDHLVGDGRARGGGGGGG